MTIATAVALVDLALGDGTGARPLDCTGREWCTALRILAAAGLVVEALNQAPPGIRLDVGRPALDPVDVARRRGRERAVDPDPRD